MTSKIILAQFPTLRQTVQKYLIIQNHMDIELYKAERGPVP